MWIIWSVYMQYFKKLPNCLPKCLYYFTFLPKCIQSFRFSTNLSALGMVGLFNCNHESSCVVVFDCHIDLHFLMIKDAEHLSMCLPFVCISSLVIHLLKQFDHFSRICFLI